MERSAFFSKQVVTSRLSVTDAHLDCCIFVGRCFIGPVRDIPERKWMFFVFACAWVCMFCETLKTGNYSDTSGSEIWLEVLKNC